MRKSLFQISETPKSEITAFYRIFRTLVLKILYKNDNIFNKVQLQKLCKFFGRAHFGPTFDFFYTLVEPYITVYQYHAAMNWEWKNWNWLKRITPILLFRQNRYLNFRSYAPIFYSRLSRAIKMAGLEKSMYLIEWITQTIDRQII